MTLGGLANESQHRIHNNHPSNRSSVGMPLQLPNQQTAVMDNSGLSIPWMMMSLQRGGDNARVEINQGTNC